MGERSSFEQGYFNWADLSTSGFDAAKDFYGALFGWEFNDLPAEGVTYSMATVRGKEVAAVYQGDGSTPPHWNNYIAVESADEIAAKAGELGGSQLMEPFDVMDVGRMAVIKDPQGAVICFWEARGHHGASLVQEPGALTWRELQTSDVEGAKTFYGDLLGWTFQSLGPEMGGYNMAHVGQRAVAGLMNIPPDGPPMPAWITVFGADDVDAAAAKAAETGGKVLREPTDIGGTGEMGRFAVVQDPQGAVFEIWTGEWAA